MSLHDVSFQSTSSILPNVEPATKTISSTFCNTERHSLHCDHNVKDFVGQNIVAIKSSNNVCHLFYYDVQRSDAHTSSQENEKCTLVQTRFTSFSKSIETLFLYSAPSGDDKSRTPSLIVCCRDGHLYRSHSLVEKSSEISMVKCQRIINEPRNESNGEFCYPCFVGMNLLSMHENSFNGQNEKDTILLVAGSRTLSAPMIVVLSLDYTFQKFEIEGLEHSRSSVCALKIFKETALDCHTRRSLQHLWKKCATSCDQPTWDACHLSIALIALNDGSVYMSYVLVFCDGETKIVEVSKAVKIYECCFPSQRIISFCLVLDKMEDKSILTWIGSQGYIIVVYGLMPDQGPRFDAVVPEPSNFHIPSMGLITQAEPLPSSFQFRNGPLLSKRLKWSRSFIATTENGSTYIFELIKNDKVYCGHFWKSALREDIAAIAMSSPDIANVSFPNVCFLASITYGRSLHVLIAKREAVRENAIENGNVTGCEQSPKIDELLEKLADLDESRKFTNPMNEILPAAIESNRKTTDIISHLCGEATSLYQHDPDKCNHLRISLAYHGVGKYRDSCTAVKFCQSSHCFQNIMTYISSSRATMQSLKALGSHRIECDASKRIPVVYGGVAKSSSSIFDENTSHRGWNTFAWNANECSVFCSSTVSMKKKRKSQDYGLRSNDSTSFNRFEKASCCEPNCFSVAIQNKEKQGLQSMPLNLPILHKSSDDFRNGANIAPNLLKQANKRRRASNLGGANKCPFPQRNFERISMKFTWNNATNKTTQSEMTDDVQRNNDKTSTISTQETSTPPGLGSGSKKCDIPFQTKKSIQYLRKVKEQLDNEKGKVDTRSYLEMYNKVRSLSPVKTSRI